MLRKLQEEGRCSRRARLKAWALGQGLARKEWAYCSQDPSWGSTGMGRARPGGRQLECLCSVNEVGLVGEFFRTGEIDTESDLCLGP